MRARRVSCTRNCARGICSRSPQTCCGWQSIPSSLRGNSRCVPAIGSFSSRRSPVADGRGSMERFNLSDAPLEPAALARSLADPACGGYVAFEGWVRDHNEGQLVARLEYEAYAELAVREGERIVGEAIRRFGVARALCVHRVGNLAIGDLAVWVGVSAAHRDEAFR